MKYYNEYMDRQTISPLCHEKLLALELTKTTRRQAPPYQRMAALAACCALIVGVGLWKLSPAQMPGSNLPGVAIVGDGSQSGSTQTDVLTLPRLPQITYTDITQQGDAAGRLAWPEGSFFRDLTQEQIVQLFADQGVQSLPSTLWWDSYSLTAQALYLPTGAMSHLTIWGADGANGSSFTLDLQQGRLPIQCAIDLGLELTTSDVLGTAVTGWSKSYDWGGDEEVDYIFGSEFMLGDVGVRFESVGDPFHAETGLAQTQMERAGQFNALFVRQVLEDGLTLDHVATTDDIPQWRNAIFSNLSQARQEAAFAPYLPQTDYSGYSEFYGNLSYQEKAFNTLWVRWSWGYDDVEVQVSLPEGDGPTVHIVDAANPAAYDVGLYPIPWFDSVPEEYRDDFYMPTFAAGDMTRQVVVARAYTPQDSGDTDSLRIRFQVLHENGVLVQYNCEGLSVDQVWAMVEGTLE